MYYTESDGNSYPAKKRIRAIDRSKVTTWSREIVNCNILEVEAGTNGYQGGDSGHGSRTYLRLKDLVSLAAIPLRSSWAATRSLKP
jgi:hypothetical protein